MTSDDDEVWPLWPKPATKGDLIQALVQVRACIIDLYVLQRAVQRGDTEAIERHLVSLSNSDTALSEVIDEIGGGRPK